MYIYDENDGYIKCGINGTIVAKMVTETMTVTDEEDEENGEKVISERNIIVRQGLEKKKVLRNIKMDLPGIAQKCKLDPENDDPELFGMLGDEDIAFEHREYLPSDFAHRE